MSEQQIDDTLRELIANGLSFGSAVIVFASIQKNGDRERAFIEGANTSDGDIEIDLDAIVSEGDDDGAYVSAWIWVSTEDAELPSKEFSDGEREANNDEAARDVAADQEMETRREED